VDFWINLYVMEVARNS